jgi:hypothetical protein
MCDYPRVIVILIAAQFVSDFLIQPENRAKQKSHISVLLSHCLRVGMLSYVLLGVWNEWRVPLALMLVHGGIDFLVSKVDQDGIAPFALDQAAHIFSTLVISMQVEYHQLDIFWVKQWGPTYLQVVILVAGMIVAVHVSGIIVAKVVQPFLGQLKAARENEDATSRGFENGGRTIGYLERALIYIFIFSGEPAVIGFLFAAKSVFRFGEIKEHGNRMEAEYIIIGTMLSFLLGTVASIGSQYVLGVVCP